MPPPVLFPPARLPLLFATLLAATGVLLLGAPTASAAKPCWERVVDDWVDNGSIDAAYSSACLQAALRNVPEDVRAYSDFEERVKQARQEAFRQRVLQGTGGGSGPTETGTTPTTTSPKVQEVEPNVREPDGPIQNAIGYGTKDASTIPLPLIILAALALILLSAGAAGFAHRKLAARKVRAR